MKLLSLTVCAILVSSGSAQEALDGIYADFSTSSGNFTASLDFIASPLTVANFIGLAEGSQPWIDTTTGTVQRGKPFYNGLTFHRVLAGFMNQAGSPNGLGSDGPGYSFKDELSNGLFHNSPYRLSMANSGANTNGSQFFITVAAASWLDGKHTVFGEVTSGQAVIDAINNVATDNNNKPTVPVVINSVSIRRAGGAAMAFNIHAQGLPVCGVLPGNLLVERNVATNWQMLAPLPAGSVFAAYRSEDLASWSYLGKVYRGPDISGPAGITLDQATTPKAFYILPSVISPGALGPSSLAGRVVSANIFAETQTITFSFDGSSQAGNGSYITAGGNTDFSFVLAQSSPNAYSANWIMNTTALGFLRLVCGFDSEDSEFIYGRQSLDQWNGTNWVSVSSGSLTVSR